ncbi:MAG: hypothetical protein KF746_00895 [Chitinophagaceae bacterium]|nr:hypothetical protein [Chitinophagaceae bacterium]
MHSTDKHSVPDEKQIQNELLKITALLRDTSFTLEMAAGQEAAYYSSGNGFVPAFLPEGSDTSVIARLVKEEKIAISIAPFYALECGIGAIMQQNGGTPWEWITALLDKKLDSGKILLLNRFANAAWKAGQPFRGLERVTREVFVSSSFLSKEEIQKDYDQLYAAATKLLPAMQQVKDAPRQVQLQRLGELLKDRPFTEEMAAHTAAAYYTALHQPVPSFLAPGDEKATKFIRLKDEKIAINIAGFYALECGLSYFATAQHRLPSHILHAIVSDSLDTKDKTLFQRFANVTWKAGQPFRGMERIERPVFTCFDLLPQDEIDKDWILIRSAAKKLLKHLE